MFPLRLIFSISLGDLRMIRSSPKLIISLNLPAPVLLAPGDRLRTEPLRFNYGKNLHRNFGHGAVGVDRYQSPLRSVVIRHSLRLRVIRRQPFGNNFGTVIVADFQLGPLDVAQLGGQRWLSVDVIDPSTGRTLTPASKPL